ncbi:putative leucine-rich repeat domain, L domain-containing protein [Medicago truncatula]|uniref:Putative leucine-rich repeat domain, L domain-containing protein n=1 Tax=Medicago truncatula TaxID=3880 RepID=A0A396JIG9_MEDTR|nr:putative leucine-rich repeat domain, L domain-containing protein [Medicago truncatula]
MIQGSGLSGPIPSGISLLKNLTELVLRNCNINGTLTQYLGIMSKLKHL